MASIFSSILGIGESAPRVAPTGTVVTEEGLATEIAPFYKDLLEKSQALHDSRLEEGYQRYQGQTVADLTQDELTAREGIRGLVGSQQADYDEARRLYGLQTEKFTADTAQEYLNPYQQAVTDVALRKAEEDFSRRVMPKFEKFASDAGGMSGLGTRAGVQAGGLGEAFMQNLSDIQTKGSAAAFDAGRAAFEAQKRREGMTAERLPALAGQEYGTQAKELAGLTAIGEDERARVQTSLDENYKDFLEERRFPEEQLQRYQSTIQGFPNLKNEIVTTSTRQPTGMQQFLSTASGLGSLYGSFGGFTEGGFGSAYTPTGTSPAKKARHGGLVGLPVVYQKNGSEDTRLDPNAGESAWSRGWRQSREKSLAQKKRDSENAMAPILWERLFGTKEKSDAMMRERDLRLAYNKATDDRKNLPETPPLSLKMKPASKAELIEEAFRSQDDPRGQGLSPYGTSSIRNKDDDIIAESIAEAEALNPGFGRDPNSPTGFNLKDGRIQVGSGGMGETDMYGALPLGARVRPQEPTKSDAQKLYDLIIKQAADRKSALEGAKKSKSERNAERTEQVRISDLVRTLGLFSGNILDPESNIGSAFGKTTTQMAASRQAEADRQAAVGDTIDDLNAKIAIAAADGDVAALTALIKAKGDAEEIRIKGTTADAALKNALAKQSTALWNRLKDKKNINLKEADLILALNEAYASAKTNPVAAKDILKTAGIPEAMIKGIIINLQTITQSAGQAAAIPRPTPTPTT